MSDQKRHDEVVESTDSGKLKQWVVQILWLVIGCALFFADQTGMLTIKIPSWVYLIFITGFSAGYDINKLLIDLLRSILKRKP